MAATLLNNAMNRNALTALYRAGAILSLPDGCQVGELTVLDATDLDDQLITITASADLVLELVERYTDHAPAWVTTAVVEALQEVYDALEQASPMTEQEQLYSAWIAADNAWQDALVRAYGRRAGDMRYVEAGRTGSELKPLYDAFTAAQDAWWKRKAQG